GGLVDTKEAVTTSLAKSTAVVGEIDLGDPSSMLKVAGMMKSDVPLKKLLSGADYKRTDSIFKWVTGYGVGFYNTSKPMVAQAQLVKSLFDKIYTTNAHPDELILDMHFQHKARMDAKTVLALETIEEQAELLFNKIPIERQAEMLMESINEFDSSQVMLRQLADCYVVADMDCLEKIGNEADGFSPEEMEALLTTRNQNWMNQLPKIFREHRAFVAVGALHLPGERGVVSLLRKAGYQVRPIPIR
ncbi:MAG TPA: TraB/GumN family protein, partial [Candidatus Kapabacteria bacterium]|nr:TraB/GumN family protein [Candidatus Kapabacteria bacterium]